MVALDLITGQRQWELNIAGISTPWVAGDWIFVVTDEAKLLCVYRQNGHIRWINQLPQFEKAKSKKGEIDYSGPVLAGGRLIVTGSNGALINVDPATGSVPEPDERRRRRQPAAGRRQLDALHSTTTAAGCTAFRLEHHRIAASLRLARTLLSASRRPCPSRPSPSSADPTSANRPCSTGWSASAWRWSTTGPA